MIRLKSRSNNIVVRCTENYPFSERKGFLFKFSIVLIFTFILQSACSPKQVTQLYENSEYGVKLEKPNNWMLEFIERNGSIILVPQRRIWEKNSTMIEIFSVICNDNQDLIMDSVEILEKDIDRISKLYDLESVTVVQEPKKVKIGDDEDTTAVIAIPTTSMPEDTGKSK